MLQLLVKTVKRQILNRSKTSVSSTNDAQHFRLERQELEMIGLALNHYSKYLRQQHHLEKAEKATALDNRIFQFLHAQKTSLIS